MISDEDTLKIAEKIEDANNLDIKKTIEKAFTYNIIDMLNKPLSMENIKNAVTRAINLSSNK